VLLRVVRTVKYLNKVADMELVLLFVLCAVFVAIMVAALQSEITSHKQRLARLLAKKGASNVVVTHVWSSGDRSNRDYAIEYIDSRGCQCQIKCKVNPWSGKIYWSEPPEV